MKTLTFTWVDKNGDEHNCRTEEDGNLNNAYRVIKKRLAFLNKILEIMEEYPESYESDIEFKIQEAESLTLGIEFEMMRRKIKVGEIAT